jgi:hypothetical protein
VPWRKADVNAPRRPSSTTRSGTFEIGRPKQPDLGEFKTFLRSCYSCIHRLALFGAQTSLQQNCGHTLSNRTGTAPVRPVDNKPEIGGDTPARL